MAAFIDFEIVPMFHLYIFLLVFISGFIDRCTWSYFWKTITGILFVDWHCKYRLEMFSQLRTSKKGGHVMLMLKHGSSAVLFCVQHIDWDWAAVSRVQLLAQSPAQTSLWGRDLRFPFGSYSILGSLAMDGISHFFGFSWRKSSLSSFSKARMAPSKSE